MSGWEGTQWADMSDEEYEAEINRRIRRRHADNVCEVAMGVLWAVAAAAIALLALASTRPDVNGDGDEHPSPMAGEHREGGATRRNWLETETEEEK